MTALKSTTRFGVLGGLFILAALAAASGGTPAEFRGLDKATGCRFQPPTAWTYTVMHWAGDCKDRLANGKGVLRAYKGASVVETFYGTLTHGQLEIGVIETDGGFIAGRFANGKRVDSQNPQDFIDAFRAASAAAEQASAHFREAGNDASAKYYAEKAKLLRDQMGD